MKTFILLTILTMTNCFAKSRNLIFCHTPRFAKSLIVGKDKVVFLKRNADASNRKIASIPSIRSKKILNGFVKELSFEGDKYRISIENETKFSTIDDYLSIRSRKGHEMTYSLSCKNI